MSDARDAASLKRAHRLHSTRADAQDIAVAGPRRPGAPSRRYPLRGTAPSFGTLQRKRGRRRTKE
jgi:hypothetical protein